MIPGGLKRERTLRWLIHTVAHELGMTRGAVMSMPRAELVDWLAYFRIRDEDERDRIERVKRGMKQ